MTTTKAERRRIGARIKTLQRDRRDVLACTGIPWGLALACDGPGSSRCHGPECEGCAQVAGRQDRANAISGQIRGLRALLDPAPAVQGAPW